MAEWFSYMYLYVFILFHIFFHSGLSHIVFSVWSCRTLLFNPVDTSLPSANPKLPLSAPPSPPCLHLQCLFEYYFSFSSHLLSFSLVMPSLALSVWRSPPSVRPSRVHCSPYQLEVISLCEGRRYPMSASPLPLAVPLADITSQLWNPAWRAQHHNQLLLIG